MAQDYVLIWVDMNISEKDDDCQRTLTQLRAVVNDIQLCSDSETCIQLLSGITAERAFVITSGILGQDLVPHIHDISKLDAIYIYCDDKSSHEEWIKEWLKIKGIYTDVQHVCKALEIDIKQWNRTSIAMSFIEPSEDAIDPNFYQLDPSFMYTKIFKDILMNMEYNRKVIRDLAEHCRSIYQENIKELQIIDEFEQNYQADKATWWYTRECFIYKMLNRSLRNLESNTIVKMGFFMHDLHQQILHLYQKQLDNYGKNSFVVYRGQGLLKADFEKLNNSIGGLMSFNNFLSTSREKQVSLTFAKHATEYADTVGILFSITVDPNVRKVPFASIKGISYFQTQEEILFSMHTVFCVKIIKQMDEDNQLYEVELQLTNDDDEQLSILQKYIQEDISGGTKWEQLGNLLINIGQFDQAEQLYTAFLEQETEDKEQQQHCYYQLGRIKAAEGDYEQALSNYEKALAAQQKILPSDHLDLATSYDNIGLMYANMEKFTDAATFYEQALEIRQKHLPSNHPDLATSYNHIGLVCGNLGDHKRALLCSEKALEIQKISLPPNHPDLVTTYNNIGSEYKNMEDHKKAISNYEKALAIQQKSLPPNHPSLTNSYNNIGSIYGNMGEYAKALALYEKAFEIQKMWLPPNHPNLATSYNNIGSVYDRMGEYSKALSNLEHALNIWQQTLPADHATIKVTKDTIEHVKEKL